MENDILDALEDIGYDGPMLEDGYLEKALEGGPKSIEYTALVEWLSKELKILCKLEEHVNAITSADDSSSFLLEVSSFLKELGCCYTCLIEGHLSDRLNSKENRMMLLDFLLTELEAARMISVNKPDESKSMQVQLNESSTASDLKNLLIALKFPKPPANITPALLFGKVEQKMKEVVAKASPELVGKPMFTGVLSDKQWHFLGELQSELQHEYRLRREMLIKRLDVTIQSFQWSDRIRNKEDEIASLFQSRRNALKVEPAVNLASLLAARDDLAIIEKTSSASVRKNTQSSINKVIIGRVPDRGGRPSEQQPPPPEMPSWQQRPGGGGGGFGGGGGSGGGGGRGGGGFQGGGRGGGPERGGRVQGGWNQGNSDRGGNVGGYQSRGGYQDRGGGGYQDRGGGGGGYQDRGGGYQDRDRGYQDRRGGGGRGGRGGRGGYDNYR